MYSFSCSKGNYFKKFSFLFIILLFSFSSSNAQIWEEDFETDGEGVRYTSTGAYFGTISNHYGRSNGTNITGGYTGQNLEWFWATEDSDDPLGDGFPGDSLTFTGIDITGIPWLLFSGEFAEGTGNDWDSDDSLALEYRVDGGAWNLFMNFDTPGPGIDLGLLEDTNLDGIGDGNNLNSSLKPYEKQLFVSGTTMDIRVFTFCNTGGEEVAFDNFVLEDASTLIPGCTDDTAQNFNSLAEMNDGSCYHTTVTVFDFGFDPDYFMIEPGETVNWVNLFGTHNVDGTFDAINGVLFNNPENFFLATGSAGTEWQYTFWQVGHYDYNCSIGDHALNGMVGSFDVGLPGCLDISAPNYESLADFDDGTCIYFGCTNPTAINYDSVATDDDGSCLNPGCTYPEAENYDPTVNYDDGSCTYINQFCAGDTDGNNIVNILDIVNVSSNFGNTCP